MIDMKIFLLSLSSTNPGSKVVLFVDDKIHLMIKEISNLNLEMTIIENLNSYSDKTRDAMVKAGTWTDFQMIKSNILDYCLNIYKDVLYLDCDIFIINEIEIPDSCELVLSPHYINNNLSDKYGYYNGGCVWTKNKEMPAKWREFSKTSRFFDQASLEDCAKIFNTKEFGENYNIIMERDLKFNDFTYDKINIYLKGKPIIFFHTHFNNTSQANFNHIISSLIGKCNSKAYLKEFITNYHFKFRSDNIMKCKNPNCKFLAKIESKIHSKYCCKMCKINSTHGTLCERKKYSGIGDDVNRINNFMDSFAKLRNDSGITYPPFAQMKFEVFFYNYMSKQDEYIKKRYIPIFWTENQISSDKSLISERQILVDSLKKDITYFTVVQHDDGITHTRLPKTIIFGMGGIGDVPIPLTYKTPTTFETMRNNPKTLFCSFMGSITHWCRNNVCDAIKDKPNVWLNKTEWTNKISNVNQEKFLEIMSQSRFSLAPRGYGKTSFRLYEALNLGSIPVYVYDQPWLPYTEILDWNKMAVLIHVNDISTMYEKLHKITDSEIADMLTYYEHYKHLFTFEGISEYIIQKATSMLISDIGQQDKVIDSKPLLC